VGSVCLFVCHNEVSKEVSGCCIRMGKRYTIERNGIIYVVHTVCA